MKARNREKKLKIRQQSWDNMKPDGAYGPKKKIIHKPSGGVLEYTRPGSLKK